MIPTIRKDHDKMVEEGRMKDDEIIKEVLKRLFPEEANCCEADMEQLTDEFKQIISTSKQVIEKHFEAERKKWADERKQLADRFENDLQSEVKAYKKDFLRKIYSYLIYGGEGIVFYNNEMPRFTYVVTLEDLKKLLENLIKKGEKGGS